MKAQVIATRYVQIEGEGESLHRIRRSAGDVIDVSRDEFDRGVELGVLREPTDAPLPEPNAAAAPPALTQPDGTPIDPEEVDGEISDSGFKRANTHAEADAMAETYGVTFPAKTRLDAKNEALEQLYAASSDATTAPALTPTSEDISELSDDELIQRGVDYGHTEEEMADKSHDELVLFVAEAMARQGSTPQAQAASVAEREATQQG